AREAAVAGRVHDRFSRREGGAGRSAGGRRVREVEHAVDGRGDVVDVAVRLAVGVLRRGREGGRVVHHLVRRGRPDEAVEAVVATRLVGELVFTATVGGAADGRALSTVDGDALEVGDRLVAPFGAGGTGVGEVGEGSLGRGIAEYLGDVAGGGRLGVL